MEAKPMTPAEARLMLLEMERLVARNKELTAALEAQFLEFKAAVEAQLSEN